MMKNMFLFLSIGFFSFYLWIVYETATSGPQQFIYLEF